MNAVARMGAVSAGAFAGTLLRWGQGALLAAPFPWATLSINVLGSLLLGLFLASDEGRDPLWRPFFAVGFCGGYTTFSSFELEVLGLAPLPASGYVAASVLLGLAAARVGLLAGPRRLAIRPPIALSLLAVVGAALLARRRELLPSFLAVALGGALGALARYGVSIVFARALKTLFPWGTLFINVTGSFAIGLLDGTRPIVRLAVVTGFLGGYTTFSTFAYEVVAIAREHSRVRAALYVAASVGLGFAAACLGARLR